MYIVRHKIRRQTMGKDAIKKSTTLVANIGQGTAVPFKHVLCTTNIGARTTTGATQNILVEQDTANTAGVGNVIKYINICIEAGPRGLQPDDDSDMGWLEYGIVKFKEVTVDPASANLGTKTLADVLTTNYRGDVIHTGCVPVGFKQPISVDLRIKIPKIFTKLQRGSELVLYCFFRSVNSTDLRSDNLRLVTSALYKIYV